MWHCCPSVCRTSPESGTKVTRARMATEQDRTEPPYMSVGLPIIPARPGAEHTTRRWLELIRLCLDVLAREIAITLVGQDKVNEGVEVALEIADVIAALTWRKHPGIDRLAHLNQQLDRVSHLNFST